MLKRNGREMCIDQEGSSSDENKHHPWHPQPSVDEYRFRLQGALSGRLPVGPNTCLFICTHGDRLLWIIIEIHPEGNMNVCANFQSNPSIFFLLLKAQISTSLWRWSKSQRVIKVDRIRPLGGSGSPRWRNLLTNKHFLPQSSRVTRWSNTTTLVPRVSPGRRIPLQQLQWLSSSQFVLPA